MQRFGKWAAAGVLALGCGVARAEEWPKWLGPEGTGISKESNIADKWPEDGPRKLWSHQVGRGFASIVGLDGKVYAFGMQGANDALTALDADSGKVLWEKSYAVKIKADAPQAKNEANGLPLPEASPTIDDGHIYTYGGAGDLVCRQLADGKEIWKTNTLDETKAHILTWNEASSPLIAGNLIYVQGGKGPIAVALDKNTGKVEWKSEEGVGGYAAPILVNVRNTPQLIIFGGETILGLNPATGKTIWKHPWKTSYDVNAATPIYRDGKLFISSNYGHGCVMFTLSPTGATKDFENKEVKLHYQPALLDKDRLYANSESRFRCMHWPDGKILWKADIELGNGGSMVLAGDKLITLSESGKLSLVQVKADGATVLSGFQLFNGDKIWSSPVIYRGKLYCKGKDELVCLDIRGEGSARAE